MKQCYLCNETKNDDHFDGHRHRCKQCRRAYNLTKRKQYLENIQAFVDGIKASNPCEDCHKYFQPCAMDFDHLPGEKKIATISKLIKKRATTMLLPEISKCSLVCACCHRIRTYNRLREEPEE